MIKAKSVGFLLLHSKAKHFCQSINFQPHPPSILQRSNTDKFIEFFKETILRWFEIVRGKGIYERVTLFDNNEHI